VHDAGTSGLAQAIKPIAIAAIETVYEALIPNDLLLPPFLKVDGLIPNC